MQVLDVSEAGILTDTASWIWERRVIWKTVLDRSLFDCVSGSVMFIIVFHGV